MCAVLKFKIQKKGAACIIFNQFSFELASFASSVKA